jgi:hypothetical protein
MRAAIYARVSTVGNGQLPEMQLPETRECPIPVISHQRPMSTGTAPFSLGIEFIWKVEAGGQLAWQLPDIPLSNFFGSER